jgi:hypothetical protein
MLARIEAGGELIDQAAAASLKEQKLARGSVKLKLTKTGTARLKKLREENSSTADEQQTARGDDDQMEENPFLKSTAAPAATATASVPNALPPASTSFRSPIRAACPSRHAHAAGATK